jgi:hypothetical protein
MQAVKRPRSVEASEDSSMRAAPTQAPSVRRFRTLGALAKLVVAAAVATTGLVAGTPSTARAADGPVVGTGKGIVGGALLGGEIGFIGLSVAGAKQTWLYYVVPGALAIGGGIGGYFIEKDKEGTDAQVPMFMLAGGMALIIPTVVITLSANAYQPANEDNTPADASPADAGGALGVKVNTSDSTNMGSPSSGGGGTTTTTPTAPPPKRKPANTSSSAAPIQRPQALVNFDDLTTIKVGLPVIALRPMYTKTEMSQFNQPQRYEVTAPVVSFAF